MEGVIRQLVRMDAAGRAHACLASGDRHGLADALRELASTGDPGGKLAAAARDLDSLKINPIGLAPLVQDRIRAMLPPAGRHGRTGGPGGDAAGTSAGE